MTSEYDYKRCRLKGQVIPLKRNNESVVLPTLAATWRNWRALPNNDKSFAKFTYWNGREKRGVSRASRVASRGWSWVRFMIKLWWSKFYVNYFCFLYYFSKFIFQFNNNVLSNLPKRANFNEHRWQFLNSKLKLKFWSMCYELWYYFQSTW